MDRFLRGGYAVLPPVRVRFAPSPTGPLHIGGARSALFNWLFARHNGGVFIVRIEDTDRERSSLESEENILAALKWLGLDWDEGIEVGGPNGPYRQTERLGLYRQYAEKLMAGGHAYHCYCTEEELAAERDALMERGETPRYLGRCRGLTEADCALLEQEGRRPVVRFRVPEDQVIHLRDLVRGEVSFECSGIGDFIIVKSDGIPTYNFAVVVDDYSMAISHVVRAEEHLSNTPRQVFIYRALGWGEPEFAHVSLILGKDRSKMSKRHGATSIEQYRDKGYLPEALVNFLALLGWSPGGEEEIFSLGALKEQFSLDRVAKSPAVFDLDKLNWLNGHYIRQAEPGQLVELAVPYLIQAGCIKPDEVEKQRDWLIKVMVSLQKYLICMDETPARASIYFADDVAPEDEEAVLQLADEQATAVLAALREKLTRSNEGDEITAVQAKAMLKELTKELKLNGKKVFMPVRVALSGKVHGPDLDQIMAILGRDKVAGRLNRALANMPR
jgi:nondiscriminating glutamyl-tRNA synthetase